MEGYSQRDEKNMLTILSSISWSGILYIIAAAFFIGALFNRHYRRVIALIGLIVLLFTMTLRMLLAAGGNNFSFYVEPDGNARWVDRLVDEGDLAILGSFAIRWTGFGREPAVEALPALMADAYQRMHRDQGEAPSPLIATLLGLQKADSFDIIQFGDLKKTQTVLVFLHGWPGGFTLPCWQVSQAAVKVNAVTVCPSMHWGADWRSPEGMRIIERTLSQLKDAGAKRIYLAGLSNGALGAAEFAAKNKAGLQGLIFISGISSATPLVAIPTLVLNGKEDHRSSATQAKKYAEDVGGKYIEFDAGHFAMLTRETEMQAAISYWLQAQED